MDTARLCLEGFQQVFSGDRFRRKFDHDLPAANGDVFLVEGVERLLAFFADIDQIRITQDGEVMGDGRLRKADLLNDLTDREFTATALAHDLLAGFVCDGFGKEDRVKFHAVII